MTGLLPGDVPVANELKLASAKELASEYFLELREMGHDVGGDGNGFGRESLPDTSTICRTPSSRFVRDPHNPIDLTQPAQEYQLLFKRQ